MRFTVDKNESLVIRSASAKVVLRKGSVTKKNIIVGLRVFKYSSTKVIAWFDR